MIDNRVWFVHRDKALTRVQVFLKDQGILHILTGVRRPTTIGKVERFHQTLNRELIKKFRFKDLEDAQESFEACRFYYNYQRPHQALGNLPPISRYKFMQGQFPKPPVSLFYPQRSLLRKVRENGCIFFKGNKPYLSEHLIGKMVKVEQKKNALEIYYDKDMVKSVSCVSG